MPPAAESQPVRAAYCDVDGTLAATTIVTPLIWHLKRVLSPPARALWFASLPLRAPWWLLLDRIDRLASNRAIYASYRGLPASRVKAAAAECCAQTIRPRLFPQALERLRELRAQNVKIVLVTGGLDFIMKPLAEELGAELYAASLEESNGVFTGRLSGPPLAGEAKAVAVRQHAGQHNIDLSESSAYGDAFGDLPMMQAVGHPVAISPDRRLARIAAANHWTVENWRE
jgi:HAD superfamily hydrolase (TIGR01490 family)